MSDQGETAPQGPMTLANAISLSRLLLLVPNRSYRTDAFLDAAERQEVQVVIATDSHRDGCGPRDQDRSCQVRRG